MRIRLTSVPVDDQEKALQFYTGKLGFVKKHDVPVGENYRWLTVVSPEEENGVELLLEPMGFAPAKTYQKQLFDAGIPYTSFAVDDIKKEAERLESQGVVFRSKPVQHGPVIIAVIEDTCGNLIQLAQQNGATD
jgi:catechol 2,3-dioxygenase-like lactoylglutathione lyase family enzyme